MLARDSSTLSYGEGISVVDMLNELEEPVVNHQKKMDGTERFCRKCRILKPDRAHHCSNCGRCVLKMDHHCPWLGEFLAIFGFGVVVLKLNHSFCFFSRWSVYRLGQL